MPTYSIVVEGKILPGYDPHEVRERIKKLYKLHDKPEHLEKLFSRQRVVVKKHLPREQAEAYSRTVRQAGMDCKIIADSEAIPAAKKREIQARTTQVAPGPEPGQQHTIEDTGDDHHDFSMTDPRKLKAAAGWDWIKEGYDYFRTNKLVWIGMVVAAMVIMIILSLNPYLSLLANIIMPVFGASFVLACYRQYQGEKPGFAILFSGFRTNVGKLITVGVLYTAGYLLITVLFIGGIILLGGGMEQLWGLQHADPQAIAFLYSGSAFFLLFALLLLIPLMMAYWFAPALVVLHNIPALKAMRMSLKGCLRNILPFTVYSLLVIVFSILAAIPMFLGYLIWMPVIVASVFASYRQVFMQAGKLQAE